MLFVFTATSVAACGPSSGSFRAHGRVLENRGNPDVESPVLPTRLADPAAPPSAPTVPTVAPAPAAAKPPLKPAVTVAPRAPFIISADVWKTSLKVPLPAWANLANGAGWSLVTHKALGEFGDPLLTTEISDVAEFCPKYKTLVKLERANVWVMIISAMVQFESSFQWWKPFSEGFLNSKGQSVVSRGLLQISMESANSYGCGIAKEAQLDDPETNLRCGVRIMTSLVSRYHSIHGRLSGAVNGNPWMGAARYWSVLRWNNKDAVIRAATRRMPQC